MSKKGVSADEKRTRMLQIFYEKKEFFQLKELEKIAPKLKGIVSQSVKEVVQSLVDDGLVDTDKIGTSVYFWAFPSKATANRKRRLDELTKSIEDVKTKRKSVEENIAKASVGKENSDDRSRMLGELTKVKQEKEQLLTDLKKFKDCDPEVVEQLKDQAETAKAAANRWTDNIMSVKSWCKQKFNVEEEMLNKQFNIPEELDYLE